MAAAATTTATVLLLLFTFSSALYRPKIDFISSDPSLVTLPDSDPKPAAAILLPSERPESEPATLAEIDPAETQSADSKSQETEQYEVKTESESETDSLPFTTVITLRPINRHFSRGPFFPIRRGHKCHGHRRQHNLHFHQFRQRFVGQGFNGQREISYGNDMIIGAKDQDRGFDRAFSGEGKRWSRYNHGGQRLSLTNSEMEEMNGMVHPHIYHHRHHRHYRHHQGANDGEEEDEHRHENGIIKGIMKFLNL